MSSLKLLDNTVIGDGQSPYIIAEVNSSHNGKFDVAKDMIQAAKDCGCNCVKFQSWSTNSLYCKSYYKANFVVERIVKKLSLTREELKELAKFAKSIGISYSSTPYCEEEVDDLVEVGAPFIKIASMDINNYAFLRYIANKQVPIILSTGMATLDEIKSAVSVIESCGNKQIALLHCISIYPADPKTINLRNILMLKDLYPNYPIGFSDHSLGIELAPAAIAIGASIIEKHLTLDKENLGMDNNMAIEPNEMKSLVDNCHSVSVALGKFDRVVTKEEQIQKEKMRRSIVSKCNIAKDHEITIDDLTAKRPGTGIPLEDIELVIGKKATCDIEADTLMTRDMFC